MPIIETRICDKCGHQETPDMQTPVVYKVSITHDRTDDEYARREHTSALCAFCWDDLIFWLNTTPTDEEINRIHDFK